MNRIVLTPFLAALTIRSMSMLMKMMASAHTLTQAAIFLN
jgi:hypothetical protein